MGTKELKKEIVNTFDYENTNIKDWKRVAKRSVSYQDNIENLRTFTNSKTGQSVWTVGEDEGDFHYFPGGQVTYRLSKIEWQPNNFEDVITFLPYGFQYWDMHCLDIILAIFNFPDWVSIFEESENISTMRFTGGKTLADFEMFLVSAGMIKETE